MIFLLYLYEKKILKELISKLKKIGTVEKIVLFGSVARGDHRPNSDIDIAVYLRNKNSWNLIDEIANEIYVKYGVPITIIKIPIEGIPPTMKPLVDEIEKNGVILWERRKK